MFKASVCLVVDSNRVRLLAYSPLAMGLLSGKYLTPDGGPPDARLNLYRGTTLAFLPFSHNLYKEVSQCPRSATNQSWGTCSLVTVAVWLRILRFLFVLVAGCYAEAECRYSLSKPNVIPAISAYMEIAQRHGISPVALAIGK
jgi:aryl-alcohol dehydrogenase-like predicted oxidoreductase